MKTALLVAGGLLCMYAWHANAQDTTATPTTAAQASALDSEGPNTSTNSMILSCVLKKVRTSISRLTLFAVASARALLSVGIILIAT